MIVHVPRKKRKRGREIQKLLPNLEHFISTELSRVMTCIKNHSSQLELSELRDSLLNEVASQHTSLEDITAQLEDGFQSIHESLEDVHIKLDIHGRV